MDSQAIDQSVNKIEQQNLRNDISKVQTSIKNVQSEAADAKTRAENLSRQVKNNLVDLRKEQELVPERTGFLFEPVEDKVEHRRK